MLRKWLLALAVCCGLAAASLATFFWWPNATAGSNDASNPIRQSGPKVQTELLPAKPLTVSARFIRRYENKEDKPCLLVACTARNISKTRQDFWMWSSSRFSNWTTDNPAVQIQEQDAMRNFEYADFLEPGAALEDRIYVTINSAVWKEAITFRVGFVPCVPDKQRLELYNSSVAVQQGNCPPSVSPLVGPFWSDKVTITAKIIDELEKRTPD